MTSNQIEYWKYLESKRHNKTVEQEDARHNEASEFETYRHNYAGETFNIISLDEASRHNYQSELASLRQAGASQTSAKASLMNARYNMELLPYIQGKYSADTGKLYADTAYTVARTTGQNYDNQIRSNEAQTWWDTYERKAQIEAAQSFNLYSQGEAATQNAKSNAKNADTNELKLFSDVGKWFGSALSVDINGTADLFKNPLK